MKFCKVSLRKIRPVAIGDKFCLKPTAEVLTSQGWIQLKDININNVQIATMDPETFELDYVLATEKYVFDYDSKVDGKLYYFKSKSIHTITTPNHEHFIKGPKASSYQRSLPEELFGRSIKYKKDCVNIYKNASFIGLKDQDGVEHTYPINSYLKLLGMFLSDGCVTNKSLVLSMRKQRKRDYIKQLQKELGIEFNYNDPHDIKTGRTKAPGIYESFKKLSVGALNKYIPNFVWKLGKENCDALLDGLSNGDGTFNSSGTMKYCTSSLKLADDVQRLIFHCGHVGTIQISTHAGTESNLDGRIITTHHDNYSVIVNKKEKEPLVKEHKTSHCEEKWIDYKGEVMCLEIPDTHLFYYRENRLSPAMWTGNSSRAGQKGICALLMREADMPFTKEGIRPAIIFNPHGMPSRMTVSQLLESLLANVCAIKGTHHDATMFKDVDIDSIADEFESYGFHRYGYERMINGITGEYIDVEIYFGPTFYQRLQKFVADAEYSVRHAMTDAITCQPLDLANKSKCWIKPVLVC
jgi:hypothetical protein